MECLVLNCPGNKDRHCVEKQNYCDTYGCDICGVRIAWDEQTNWLTSSYGICDECYNKLTEEEIEKLRKEYE